MGSHGSAVLPVDLGVLPGGTVIATGEHWFFQMWFRDKVTSNITDGLDILFR